MTQLIGKPDVPDNTPLKATVTYTGAYQRGDALGIGTVTYTWDWTDNRWERTDGTLANIIAARFNQNDPAPPALRILFRIGTGDGTLGRPVEVLAAETAAGVLDVTKPLQTAPYITGPDLAALIAQAQAAVTASQGAAAQITAAQTALNTERAAVAADLTQTAALRTQLQATVTDAVTAQTAAQQQINVIQAVSDLGFAYAAVNSTAAAFEALRGYGVYAVQGGAEQQISSNNTTAPVQFTVAVDADGWETVTLAYDPVQASLTTDSEGGFVLAPR